MKEEKYFIPETRNKIVLTKLVKKKFGLQKEADQKMSKKDRLVYVLFIVFCVAGFIGLCINAEHFNEKKELSTQPTTIESR